MSEKKTRRKNVTRAMKAAIPQYPIVKVLFWDHNSVDEWTVVSDHDSKPTLVSTIGYVVSETDTVISVASTIDDGGHSCCCFNIVKSLIVSIKRYEHDILG